MQATEKHVTQAIDAALAAKRKLGQHKLGKSGGYFSKGGDLFSNEVSSLPKMEHYAWTKQKSFQAEIDAACELIDFLAFQCSFSFRDIQATTDQQPGHAQPDGVSSA
jgi:1-pyrroline-5-carboxylate dehydrogenase